MTQALSVGNTIVRVRGARHRSGVAGHAVSLSIAKHHPLLSSTVISCDASAMNW
jgi:hypothetical protein